MGVCSTKPQEIEKVHHSSEYIEKIVTASDETEDVVNEDKLSPNDRWQVVLGHNLQFLQINARWQHYLLLRILF